MRILMLAPQPFFEPRGTPFSVLGRLNALSALGHEVDLATYHVGREVTIPGLVIHRTPNVPFIKTVKIGPSICKLFLDCLVFVKAIQLLRRRRYDLVHSHEEAGMFGILLAKLFKVPHIYDMHSSLTQQLSNFKYTHFGPLIRFFNFMEHRVVKSSDAIITICPALEEHVKRIDQQVPQMMIENVSTERDPAVVTEPEAAEFLAIHPQLEGKRVVFYAGTFEPYQGIDLMISSAHLLLRRHDDVLFLMVGGKSHQVEMYRKQVAELGLSAYFHFTGSRSPAEIPIFMKLSHILVSPRIAGTNTPLKIYSYLQSGKPIVATNLYTHTQVLNSDVSMLVEPDAESLAQGMLALLENHQLATNLGSNARQLFETNYSYQTYIRKTEEILRMASE